MNVLAALPLALVAAVGSCLPEATPLGRLDVVNRTVVDVTISTMDGSEHFTVPACQQRELDRFPLNRFRIDALTSPNGYIWGADISRPILIVEATGPTVADREPDPLPPCQGQLP